MEYLLRICLQYDCYNSKCARYARADIISIRHFISTVIMQCSGLLPQICTGQGQKLNPFSCALCLQASHFSYCMDALMVNLNVLIAYFSFLPLQVFTLFIAIMSLWAVHFHHGLFRIGWKAGVRHAASLPICSS